MSNLELKLDRIFRSDQSKGFCKYCKLYVPLENVSNHLEDIRSAKHCIRTKSYTAGGVKSLL